MHYRSGMNRANSLTIAIIFLFCAGLEVCVCFLFQGPAPVSILESNPDGDLRNVGFSAERAIEIHRRVFPDAPHPAGSPENADVRLRIVELLEEHGWQVEPPSSVATDEFIHGNIVAFRPDQQTLTAKPLVLASHFDSCIFGPGAGDAGGCVAAVIEAGRLLTKDTSTLRRPVWLVLTDAEEAGLVGARELVKSHPLSQQHPIVLNFDARGNAGPVCMFETHAGNHEAIRRLVNKLPRPRLTGSLFTTVYKALPNGTDFTEFRSAGWQGFNFALIDGARNYHRPEDTLENLDARSVQHLGEAALTVAQAIATTDDDFNDHSQDALFFDVLGGYVIHMPISWNFPIRFALLFAAVQVYGRPLVRRRHVWPVVRVWLTMAMILPMACALGWLVSRSIIGTSLLSRPFVAHGHWLSLGMWFICLAACCMLAYGMLRRINQQCLWDAFWLAHAATCMVVSIFLPEFSYLLSVPAMFALVTTLLLRSIPARTRIVACLSAVLLIPLDHLISIALGPANGMLLFPVYSLLIMPMLPAFGSLPGSDSESCTSSCGVRKMMSGLAS